MRTVFVPALLLVAGCTQSPQAKQTDQICSDARKQAHEIKDRAEVQASPLDQQAKSLQVQAKQIGGYAGKRLEVQANSLKQQAKLVRQQADEQGDAVQEAADARVKAINSH